MKRRLPRKARLWKSGGRIYGICPRCKKVVRLDKPVLGDLHLCV